MRTGALLLALALAATAPSLAQAKRLHHHRVAPAPEAMNPNPGLNPFIVEGLRQIIVPAQVTLQALTAPPPAPPHVVRHRRGHRV